MWSKKWIHCAFISIMFLMLALVASGNAVAEPLLLGSKGSYDLAGHLAVLQDPSGKMGLDEVLAADKEGLFRPVTGNFTAGYSTSACWFRLTLIRGNSFPEEGWLRFSPSYLDEVTLHIQRPDEAPGLASSYRIVPVGALVPATEKPLIHPELVAPVKLGTGQPVTVYVRVFTSSSLFIEGSVHTLVDLTTCTEHYLFLQSAYLGIALLIAVINLLIFLANRDRQYLFFSLYVFALFLTSLTMKGMQPYVLPSVTPLFSWFVSGIIFGVRIIILSLFLLSFFKNKMPHWALLYLRFMIIVGTLEILSVPFDLYTIVSPWSIYATFGMIIVALWMSIRMLRKSTPIIRVVFMIVLGSNAVFYVLYFLQNLGIIAVSPLHANTPQILSLADFIIIFFVLIDRMRKTERKVLENTMITEERATVLAKEMTDELHKIFFVIIKQLHKAERKALENTMITEERATVLAKEITDELHENKAQIELSLAMKQRDNERMQRFLTMISHEYRTPLAIIQGNLDLLKRKEHPPAAAELPELLKMQRAVERLVEIMNVSLEKSQLMETKLPKSEPILLTNLLTQQVNFARQMWSERNFLLHVALQDEMIYGEESLLNTVLFNLLDNAQKYSPIESSITITALIDQGDALVTIHNESEGLDEIEATLCFEKFHRGRNAGNKSGAGLGLWLVQHIIEQHGGNIRLQCNDTKTVLVELRIPVVTKKTENTMC
jgi:two-component system, sensor histidine kinase LadS